MKNSRVFMAFGLIVLLSGCYNATIDTGLTPSTVTIEEKWATSLIAGLVPPKTIETMEKCPNGVAKVSTRLSFLNQVAAIVTFSIYTPMEIIVTCAADGSASLESDINSESLVKQRVTVKETATRAEKEEAFKEAIKLSAQFNKDVEVVIER